MINWLEPLRSALREEFGDRPVVVALATVSLAAEPAGRHMICRGVGDDGRFTFTMDGRSEKATHLSAHASAECAIWLGRLRRQYRVSGRVTIESDAARREQTWRELSSATRSTFFGPPPGTPVVPGERRSRDANIDAQPGSFTVFHLVPDRVELLDLKTTPHDRTEWRRQTGWTALRIHP